MFCDTTMPRAACNGSAAVTNGPADAPANPSTNTTANSLTRAFIGILLKTGRDYSSGLWVNGPSLGVKPWGQIQFRMFTP
jgi:hypothetical protein